jgi:hypothetical protein
MQKNPSFGATRLVLYQLKLGVRLPNSLVLPLAKIRSDHVPCVVNIDTSIPKAKLFRFGNYWVELPCFLECVSKSWANPSSKRYSYAPSLLIN